VAGRPSMGKTALVLNFILNLENEMIQKDYPILFFSLETNVEQIIQRMLAIQANVPLHNLRKPPTHKPNYKHDSKV
jgi:replicative DNA helicase